MKPESPFSKFPSLSELLNHPTVQGVVERVNQTTVAQRAHGFLEELQAGWKEQGGMPSVGEMAERLAQRLLGRANHSSPTVNATGVICSHRWQSPLAEPAVHELLRFASDYQQPSTETMSRVAGLLSKLAGADAAWVASSYEAAISMTAQCAGAKLDSSPLLGLLDPADLGHEHVDTIADRLREGADLVVVDGSGLLGGPRCGIVLGKKTFVEQMKNCDLADALAANAMVLAALEATLEIYRSPEKVIHQIPVMQLLSTPLANLQQRCERIAPQLAELDHIASAEPVARDSVWLDTGDSQLSAASWSVSLQPSTGSVEELSQRFQQAAPQVVSRQEDDKLWLDFRAVFPRWDQHLIAALDRTS